MADFVDGQALTFKTSFQATLATSQAAKTFAGTEVANVMLVKAAAAQIVISRFIGSHPFGHSMNAQ
jgi:hypothetical protein